MRYLALLIMAASLGCGTNVSYTQTNPSPVPLQARPTQEVEVYNTPPSRPFKEIGYIEAQQQTELSGDSQRMVLQKLRARAGKVGCQAIIIVGTNNSVGGNDGTTYTLEGYRAACIVFTGPPAAGEPAPPARQQLCVPNETKKCFGPGACTGGQACLPDGSGYSKCDCANAAPAETPAPDDV